METSEILLSLRKEKKISQKILADLLGVSITAYQNYEYGKAELNYAGLKKLAYFYDVTTDYLLGIDNNNAKPPVNPVDEFVSKTQMKEQEQIVLKKWLALDEKQRQTVFNFMVDIVHEYESELNKEADDPNKNPETVSDNGKNTTVIHTTANFDEGTKSTEKYESEEILAGEVEDEALADRAAKAKDVG